MPVGLTVGAVFLAGGFFNGGGSGASGSSASGSFGATSPSGGASGGLTSSDASPIEAADVAPVPELSSYLLVLTGLALVMLANRRRLTGS